MIGPLVAAGATGHASVTAIAGAVATVQVVETVFVTVVRAQISLPIPRKVVVTEQALAGMVFALVKLADAPGASVAVVNTVVLAAGQSLSTTTFVKVILPVFRTVPL